MSTSPILDAACLVRRYPVRSGAFGRTACLKAVDGVDLRIERGESVALVGESGCGKSTVARLVTKLETPDEGRIVFAGRDVTHLRGRDLQLYRRQIQLIFQDPLESLNPRQTVEQIISRPLINYELASGRELRLRVEELLELVGLEPPSVYLQRYPHQLSGGQRQRVGIAAALALNPQLLVADEATASLDISVRAQILNLLKRLQSELNLSILFITHDLGVVSSLCSKTLVMYLGKIVESGSTPEVFTSPAHPYTRALIAATPVADPRTARNRAAVYAQGEVPSALAPPRGCTFHPRCPIAKPGCVTLPPLLQPLAISRHAACHFPFATSASG